MKEMQKVKKFTIALSATARCIIVSVSKMHYYIQAFIKTPTSMHGSKEPMFQELIWRNT